MKNLYNLIYELPQTKFSRRELRRMFRAGMIFYHKGELSKWRKFKQWLKK